MVIIILLDLHWFTLLLLLLPLTWYSRSTSSTIISTLLLCHDMSCYVNSYLILYYLILSYRTSSILLSSFYNCCNSFVLYFVFNHLFLCPFLPLSNSFSYILFLFLIIHYILSLFCDLFHYIYIFFRIVYNFCSKDFLLFVLFIEFVIS